MKSLQHRALHTIQHTQLQIISLTNLIPTHLSRHRTAAFALRQALPAISQPRVPTVAITFLDTIGTGRPAPQTPRHALHDGNAARAAGLHLVHDAVPALAAV